MCSADGRQKANTSGYLPITAFASGVHLAVVFGVVVKETGLAVAEPDHAAVVRVLLSVVAEELPAHHVSARARGGSTHVHVEPRRNIYSHTDKIQLTLAGRECTGHLYVCRRRSRLLGCSGRSSTDGLLLRLKTGEDHMRRQPFVCIAALNRVLKRPEPRALT